MPGAKSVIRRLCHGSLLCLLVVSHCFQGRSAAPSDSIESFEQVWRTIYEHHFDTNFNGVDWVEIKEPFRKKVASAESPDAVRDVLQELLDLLEVSHLAIISSDLPDPSDESTDGDPSRVQAVGEEQSGTAGFQIRFHGDDALVTQVHAGGAAEKAGIKPGWVLRRVGDLKPSEFKRKLKLDARKAEFLAWRTVARKLSGAPGTTLNLEFLNHANRAANITLVLERTPGEPVQFGSLPVLYADLASKRVEQGRASIGVIRFNIWMLPTALAFNKAVDEHRDADGLIIDLRGNVGGMVGMLIGTAGHFLDKPVSLGKIVMRDNQLNLFANPRVVDTSGNRVRPFSGPVAIFVDEITASASEVFAGGLQDLGRARVFGRTTAGQALPAMHQKLPNGDFLYHPIADFIPPKGSRFEGRGVIPDVPIELDRKALLAGRDLAMEQASAWIQNQPRRPK